MSFTYHKAVEDRNFYTCILHMSKGEKQALVVEERVVKPTSDNQEPLTKYLIYNTMPITSVLGSTSQECEKKDFDIAYTTAIGKLTEIIS